MHLVIEKKTHLDKKLKRNLDPAQFLKFNVECSIPLINVIMILNVMDRKNAAKGYVGKTATLQSLRNLDPAQFLKFNVECSIPLINVIMILNVMDRKNAAKGYVGKTATLQSLFKFFLHR
nr:PREDICTED: uncharacterized protein LOC103278769 isoform X2 [Anolis carolinensis]|eukprot:XP_008108286.2 PREDICTED: uncharacterized protein LOC103278769 isoform X2 [Anolis carolinensis]